MTKTLWELAEEDAVARREQADREDADPVRQARLKAKRDEEFARGVRLGWHDADGNPLNVEADDADDENEDEAQE